MGLESIKNMGRFGDTELAHVTPGEVVLPPNFLNENPKLKQAIEKILDKDDTSIAELMVGDNMNSINPSTGLPEFFLKKLGKKIGKFWNKKVKPVVNKVAKVAKFVPGPWQLPAQMYDTGRVAVNVIKGDQDPLALLRNLGQAYAFTNIGIKDGKLVNPSDKFSTDAIGGRTRDFFRSKFGGEQTATGSQSASEIAKAQGYEQVPGVPNSFIKDGTVVSGEQLLNSAAKSSGFFDSTKNFFSGLDGQPGFGFGDILAGGGKFFDFLGSAREGIMGKTGLDPALLALATAYGKATERALEKERGGMEDIRVNLRSDLKQPTPFSGGGFDLGLVKNPVNAFADGGEVLDMRKGGESVGPGTGTSDDIPAMLSDGEFVMTAKANLGAGAMKINKKKGGIMEMVPSLEPDRKRGADNMMKLMRYFEGVA